MYFHVPESSKRVCCRTPAEEWAVLCLQQRLDLNIPVNYTTSQSQHQAHKHLRPHPHPPPHSSERKEFAGWLWALAKHVAAGEDRGCCWSELICSCRLCACVWDGDGLLLLSLRGSPSGHTKSWIDLPLIHSHPSVITDTQGRQGVKCLCCSITYIQSVCASRRSLEVTSSFHPHSLFGNVLTNVNYALLCRGNNLSHFLFYSDGICVVFNSKTKLTCSIQLQTSASWQKW